jgi:D-alanyl-D-alanine carboxypeptidase
MRVALGPAMKMRSYVGLLLLAVAPGCGATDSESEEELVGESQSAVTLPTITAERAVVLDPQSSNVIYAKNGSPVEAAMGSTAKIMTMYVALKAVSDGHVAFSDKITISAKAAKQACNCFASDSPGILVAGDKMTLHDALSAVAISDGEPTVAVAEYVAKAVVDGSKTPNATEAQSAYWEQQFIGLMNDEVDALGLADTHFATVHGGDEPSQHISPESLALLWEHGRSDHQHWLTYLGWWNRDLYVYPGGAAVGVPYNEKNAHTFYPNVEGAKGGNSVECIDCFVTSADRLGRRVTATNLQSTSNTADAAEQLRFGFEKLLEPKVAASAPVVGIQDHALSCSGNEVISAAGSALGKMLLMRHTASADGKTLSFVDWLPTNDSVQNIDVERINPNYVVTIEQRQGGAVELRSWSWGAGAPTLVDTESLGSGSILRVNKLAANRLAANRLASTGLVMQTFALSSTGALSLLDTKTYNNATLTELDAAANTNGEVLVALRKGGSLHLRSYAVNLATGLITLAATMDKGPLTSVRTAFIGNGVTGPHKTTSAAGNLVDNPQSIDSRYAVSYIDGAGWHEIAYVRTNANVPYWMQGWGDAGLLGSETAVTGVRGSGAASVYRGLGNQDHLAVSDFPWAHPVHTTSSASDDLKRRFRRVSHSPPSQSVLASQLEICSVSSGANSAAAQVSAIRDPASQLVLRLWREGAN